MLTHQPNTTIRIPYWGLQNYIYTASTSTRLRSTSRHNGPLDMPNNKYYTFYPHRLRHNVYVYVFVWAWNVCNNIVRTHNVGEKVNSSVYNIHNELYARKYATWFRQPSPADFGWYGEGEQCDIDEDYASTMFRLRARYVLLRQPTICALYISVSAGHYLTSSLPYNTHTHTWDGRCIGIWMHQIH